MWAHERVTRRLPLALYLVDLVLIAASFYLVYQYRFTGLFLDPNQVAHTADHRLLGLSALLIWPPTLYLFDLYNPARLRAGDASPARLLQACLLVGLLTAALIFAFKAKLTSRMVFALFFMSTAVLLWAVRWGLGFVLTRWSAHLRVVVVGTGPVAARVSALLERDHPGTSTIVGYFDAGEDEVAVPTQNVLGDLEELAPTLERQVVDRVVITVSSQRLRSMEDVVVGCRELGIDVVIVPDFLPLFMSHALPGSLFGIPILRLDASPQFRAVMIGKRVFDVVGALVLAVVTAPLVFAGVLSTRFSSPGPALFVQKRVGLNGRPFRLYKLRTMVVGAERMQAQLAHLNEINGPAFKMQHDPRVTPVGRVLRRFSVDELPQLINVLKGDMSLVGPRPSLPEEVARYNRRQRRRLSIRPGMTGTWQVSGRSDMDFEKWVEFDLMYIDNWSPWLDLKILVRTLPAVIRGRGAR